MSQHIVSATKVLPDCDPDSQELEEAAEREAARMLPYVPEYVARFSTKWTDAVRADLVETMLQVREFGGTFDDVLEIIYHVDIYCAEPPGFSLEEQETRNIERYRIKWPDARPLN